MSPELSHDDGQADSIAGFVSRLTVAERNFALVHEEARTLPNIAPNIHEQLPRF